MDKKIPIYFDNVIIASPIQQVSETNPNLGRLKVGVFTKYGNRNGSYITDQVAEMLINSAIKGDTPVIGFFDPETKSWASHTGPTLASAYGYVETFEGWQPLTDTDGQTRDYAIFTVVLFTKYFEEANLIIGQHQSMELDINSINGDWADINGIEYYVYTTAAIQGLCVIGTHEPCFSVSSFFSKDDENYKNQYEKFNAFLADAKVEVEKAIKGGEQPMNELENVVETEAVEPTPEVVEEVEIQEEVHEEEQSTEEEVAEEPAAEPEEEETEPAPDFAALQQQLNDLQASYDELKNNFEVAQNRVNELEASQAEFENLRAENEQIKATLATYAEQAEAAENARKNDLIDKYEKFIDEEEIAVIKAQVSNYSYDELKSKLAIIFADKQMAEKVEEKVPLPEQPESQFALLMKKYRKN